MVAGTQCRVRPLIWHGSEARRLEIADETADVYLDGGAVSATPSEIVTAVRRTLGIESLLVRVVAPDEVEVEYLSGRPPSGARWRPVEKVPTLDERPMWQRPGWLRQVLPSADELLATAGLRRVGEPVQTRHTSVTAMLRIPTDGGSVWLKAVLPIFAREAAVVRWLGSIAATSVPTVLVEGQEWWISAEFPPSAGSPCAHFLTTLAELQVASADRVPELRALGCPDRSLPRLVEDLSALADRDDLVEPRDRSLLGGALRRFGSVCEQVDALEFPTTLVHGDVHPGNLRWTSAGWFIYDWTDACVAHPVVELALPLNGTEWSEGAEAFRSVWSKVLPELDVSSAIRAAPVLGAAHQAASYKWIVDAVDHSAGDESNVDQLLGLLRSWVRRVVELV